MADIQEVVEQQIAGDAKGVAIPILKRTGKPYLAADGSRSTITLIGSESKQYRDARDAIWREAAQSSDDADAAATRIAIAAAAVTSWHGWEANGSAIECTPENVRTLLSIEHILLQVEGGVGRRTDFFDDGSKG